MKDIIIRKNVEDCCEVQKVYVSEVKKALVEKTTTTEKITIGTGSLGAMAGVLIGGPFGAVVGGALGAFIGYLAGVGAEKRGNN